MINPINHYAFQNCPTVYDEDAMTALELVGRMGHKLNEVISTVNGYNVPKIVHVSPTGDMTGELDRATIQGKLDKGYAVHLSAGEYYLNGPLIFRPGYMLRGDSQLNTVINAPMGFIDHEAIVSVDHITVRDVRVKCGEGSVGIDIGRKAEGVETGGRYAHFMNVYLSGAEVGVRLNGCWCTNFTHCRIEAELTCVEQQGSCNHIKYDHCVFLGPTGVPYDEMSAIGIDIDTRGGAENYGITIDHCDFERFMTCVNAYCCVSLNVSHLYVEWSRKVFELDSCPSFLCDGGYVSYANRICNTKRTNTASVFSKCNGAIKNLYVRADRDEQFALVSTTAEAPLEVTGINVVNDSTGECVVNNQMVTGLTIGHEHHTIHKIVERVDDLTFSRTPFALSNQSTFTLCGCSRKPGHRYKLQSVGFVPHQNFTPTKDCTLAVSVIRKDIGYTELPSQRVTLMEAYLNAGQTYSMNSEIKFTVKTENYRDLIMSDIDSLRIAPTVSGYAENVHGAFNIVMASGEMIL